MSRKGKMVARNLLGGIYQLCKALSIPTREERVNVYNEGYHKEEISPRFKVN